MYIQKIKKNLTTIILCGGKGQRLKPITNKTPKSLIKIDNKEILTHIIKNVKKYNIDNFLVLTGYKKKKVESFLRKNFKNKINYLDTGQNTDILRRIKKGTKFYKDYLLICYGDTLADININKLIKYHFKKKSNLTMSLFNQKLNFGIVSLKNTGKIKSFLEKPRLNNWINIGYIFVKKDKFFSLSKNYLFFSSFLQNLGNMKNIYGFQHTSNHITVNTLTELDEAKKKIKMFNKG